MKSYFSLFLLVMAFSLVYTNNVDAQKSKTKKTTKKKDSEYVPDDYVPDTYVPDDYVPESNKKTVKGKTNSAAKSTGPKSTGPTAPVIVAAKDTVRKPDADAPLDDFVKRELVKQKIVLAYEPVHERDVFWERRIWRVIDCREKMNLPFKYPDHELFTILKNGIESGDIRCYSTETFQYRTSTEDINKQISKIDTSQVYDPETQQYIAQITKNDLDVQSINQYRIKEVWFFDSEASQMKVRILGIAPMYVKVDPTSGIELPPMPLFWIYYPDCRKYLSQFQVFNEQNVASPISWDDMFENRHFSSYITKRSNVNDNRLVDYEDLRNNGVDMLLESNKIKEEIFNFEHDVWSY
ncbi:MAG: gliding motility protein GldN [Saprospiraceae bacterium]|nr:gliding motility protein GldN [Saprospiraceae bacterium]MCO5278036.1 gliding motility protein GldN [Saprospiraceae bacterium]